MNAGIIGIGHRVPDKVFTNQMFVEMGLDTSDEWIENRTGIRERRIAGSDESTIDLAYSASINALKDAKKSPQDLDLIIVATSTSDYKGFPSTACLLQQKLEASQVGAFDISVACSGFSYALSIATQFIENKTYKTILIVGVDCLSKFVNWEDRSTCILFGDGAGAAVLSQVQNEGIKHNWLFSDGREADILKIPSGGTKAPITESEISQHNHLIHMDGKAVFKVAVSRVVKSIKQCLEEANIDPNDIDYVAPHQANIRILDAIAEKCGIARHKFLMNVDRFGNTSAASIPIVLSEAVSANQIKSGSLILTVGFGAGFTWAINLMRWQ